MKTKIEIEYCILNDNDFKLKNLNYPKYDHILIFNSDCHCLRK